MKWLFERLERMKENIKFGDALAVYKMLVVFPELALA